MALKAGIVGLPNVGKSTLFNCLSSAKAQAANFPFCTIDAQMGQILPGDGFYTGAKQYSRPLFCQPEGLAPGKKYPMRHRIRFSQRHDPLRPVLL